MKTKKQLYDPPVVETVTLQVESFVCQSDLSSEVGIANLQENDYSDLGFINFTSVL